jgi:natural product precursor
LQLLHYKFLNLNKMKELKKMNLNELKTLSRREMKNVMAGSGITAGSGSNCGSACDQQAYCCITQTKDTCCKLEADGCTFIVGSDGSGCPK